MTSGELVAILEGVERAELGWRALLADLHALEAEGRLCYETVIGMQGRIEAVVKALADHGEKSKGMVQRCLQIAPCASREAPAGF